MIRCSRQVFAYQPIDTRRKLPAKLGLPPLEGLYDTLPESAAFLCCSRGYASPGGSLEESANLFSKAPELRYSFLGLDRSSKGATERTDSRIEVCKTSYALVDDTI